ncbi:cystathionine betasynthase [Colletotrichum higginsianum]|nr:cystathionine betasynthase [Colletotrichum higginsianum]
MGDVKSITHRVPSRPVGHELHEPGIEARLPKVELFNAGSVKDRSPAHDRGGERLAASSRRHLIEPTARIGLALVGAIKGYKTSSSPKRCRPKRSRSCALWGHHPQPPGAGSQSHIGVAAAREGDPKPTSRPVGNRQPLATSSAPRGDLGQTGGAAHHGIARLKKQQEVKVIAATPRQHLAVPESLNKEQRTSPKGIGYDSSPVLDRDRRQVVQDRGRESSSRPPYREEGLLVGGAPAPPWPQPSAIKDSVSARANRRRRPADSIRSYSPSLPDDWLAPTTSSRGQRLDTTPRHRRRQV